MNHAAPDAIPAVLCGYPVHRYTVRLPNGPLWLLGPHDPDSLLDDPRTSERYYAENEYIPYWAHLWPAAIMLAEYVERVHPRMVGTALELGCGLGLAGLAAARCGWQTTLTDYDADSLQFASHSGRCNGIRLNDIRRMDWTAETPSQPVDLLLGADILFESRWVEPVARLIRRHITTGAALICDPNRRTSEGFESALDQQGLCVQRISTSTDQPDLRRVDGTIYIITSEPA